MTSSNHGRNAARQTLELAGSAHSGGDDGETFVRFAAASPDCIRILHLDGRVEFINAGGVALFEVGDLAADLGTHWPSMWPEISRPAIEAVIEAAVAGETRSFRAFCPTGAGTPKWWDTAVWPVFAPGGSKPIRLVARSRDITEEVQTSDFLEAIVDFNPAGLFVKDASTGRFLLVNRAAETVLGFSRDELIGKTDHDLFPEAQANYFRETDLAVIRSGELTEVEEQVTTRSGDVRWFRTKKVALRGVEGAQHLLALAEDITDVRAADEALRQALNRAQNADRAKSDFLATMSHEIRTPLNGVLGMAQAMQAGDLCKEQRGRLRVIRRSGETLLAILNDVLDLSKIEAGALTLALADFDLEHLVRNAIAALSPEAGRKGLSVRFELAAAARDAFVGDPIRVLRVLYGLLSNAVKFTDAGGVELTAGYEAGVLQIAVADTGIGIGAELIPYVFDKFVQGDSSPTRRFAGSGLGLSICRGLVEIMGGSLEVESVVGQGSVFTFRVPLQRASAPAVGRWSAADCEAPAPLEGGPGLRVLAAEDNAANRLVLRTLLLAAGVDARFVEDGAQALAAWEAESWDLILMDIQMPVMDGMVATLAIRAREAETGRARTPILAVTANAMTYQVATYDAVGMDGVIPKPVDAAQLLAGIERVIAVDEQNPFPPPLAGAEAIIALFRPERDSAA